MQITITLTIEVPDGAEVAVSTATTQTTVPRLRDTVGEVAADLKYPRSRWTRSEELLAQDLSMSDEEVAERIGRTELAVHTFRRESGIVPKSRDRHVEPVPRAMHKWTTAEIDMLTEYAGTETPAIEVAEALGRTLSSVQTKAIRLELITSRKDWK